MNNSVLPKSLQSEINTREELKQKLRARINQNKEKNNKPSAQMKQKLEKDAKKEKAIVDSDTRVTHNMKHYFIKAMQAYPGIDLANPVEILNNSEKYKLDYYKFCIDLLKKNNNNQEVLKNSYCDYMKEVLSLS